MGSWASLGKKWGGHLRTFLNANLPLSAWHDYVRATRRQTSNIYVFFIFLNRIRHPETTQSCQSASHTLFAPQLPERYSLGYLYLYKLHRLLTDYYSLFLWPDEYYWICRNIPWLEKPRFLEICFRFLRDFKSFFFRFQCTNHHHLLRKNAARANLYKFVLYSIKHA